MTELINYLNSPHLVAEFQKIFGIEPHFNSNINLNNHSEGSLIVENNSIKESNSNRVSTVKDKTNINNKNNNESDDLNQRLAQRKKIIKKNENNLAQKETNVETIRASSVSDTNQNNPNSHFKHKRQSSGVKMLINTTDHSHIVAKTTIHSRFWYYFFHLGASMGNEIFYCLFFPFWFWNVDSVIGRKVGFLWGIFMYFGQATKDLLCMPRPASPPVVKLEERYVKEYGFPSTHAMVSAGLPISVVVLSYSRYNIDLTISACIAAAFCIWVCSSRLYLGMHSLLDVIAGVLYSVLILILVIPILEPIDTFIVKNEYSPLVVFVSGYLACHFYPSLKQWSTARGDTTIIIGSVVGFSIGSFVNYQLGYLSKPIEPPLYDIRYPDALGYLFGIIRTIIGLMLLFAIRVICKASLLRFICAYYGLDMKDPATRQEKAIELPYNYITYFAMGLNIAFIAPYIFRLLEIQRDYSYTEL